MTIRRNECPRLGPYCITSLSPLYPREKLVIDDTQLLQELSLSCDMTRHITPISTAIQLLLDTEKTLQSYNSHPPDQSVVGVPTDDLARLQLVVARTPSRQPSVLESSFQDEAAREVQTTRELVNRFTPVSRSITEGAASAETVMETLHAEADPSRARRVLWAQVKGQATVISDGQILAKGTPEPSSGSVSVPGQDVHQIQVDILRSDRERSSFKVKLLKTLSATTLFKPADCGTQVLLLDVPDRADFFLIGQSMALGWPVAISVSVDVVLSARGVEYRATLLVIPKSAELAKRLSSAVAAHTLELFST